MKKALSLLLIIALLAGLAGCLPQDKQVLTVGVPYSLWLNPLYADNDVLSLLFDSPLNETADGSYKMSAAQDLQISSDYKTVTVTLRKKMKFSDGSNVTAEDMVFLLNVLSDPAYNGPYAAYAALVEGYEERISGEADSLKGVTVSDPLTLTVTFREGLRGNLRLFTLPLISSTAYKPLYTGSELTALENATKPVGSGAYRVAEYDGETLTLSKNRRFHSADDFAFDEIRCLSYEGSTAQDALKAKNADLVLGSRQADVWGSLTAHSYTSASYTCLALNASEACGMTAEMRRALCGLIDRDTLLWKLEEAQLADNVVPQNGLMPADSWAAVSITPEEDNSLANELGWFDNPDKVVDDTKKPFAVKFVLCPEDPVQMLLAEEIRGMLSKANGLRIEYVYLTQKNLESALLQKSDWHLCLYSTKKMTADPDELRLMFADDKPFCYSSEAVEESFEALKAKEAVEAEDYAALQKTLITEDCVLYPLITTVSYDLVSENLTGYQTGLYGELAEKLREVRPVEQE